MPVCFRITFAFLLAIFLLDVHGAAAQTPPEFRYAPEYATARAEYLSRVKERLARGWRYPKEAERLGQEGAAVVRFTISARGTVASTELKQSTGFALLDREAVAMVRRAAPYPPPPHGKSVDVTAPLRFRANTPKPFGPR